MLDLFRRDPIGAGLAVLLPLLVMTGLLAALEQPWRFDPWEAIIAPIPRIARPPLPDGDKEWVAAAASYDRITIPGLRVAYWGNPSARYSETYTARKRRPRAVVVHYTYPKHILAVVKYGHRSDASRGGASFGYHYYVDGWGRVAQGAPLSRRTNHIKRAGHPKRSDMTTLDNANTIAVSLVGGCDPARHPAEADQRRCGAETVTAVQMDAALRIVRAIQERYGIDCRAVYGHGELQVDREAFEGRTVTQARRAECR